MEEFDLDDEGEDDAEPGREESNDTAATGGGPDAGTVAGLAGEALASILAEAWTNRGWQTDVVADDDGTFLVTGDQGSGTRGLILVLPGDGAVPGKRLQQYVTLVERKSVDVRVVATQGRFTDDAARIANANDVHLLDPEAVLETVLAEGLEASLEAHGGGTGGGLGAVLAGLPIPAPSLSLPGRGGGKRSGARSTSGLLVVLVVVSLLAGFAGGAFLTPATGGPLAGGGVGGAIGATLGGLVGGDGGNGDLAVGALSTARAGDAGLAVRWNARPAGTVVANGSTYEAPPGTRFVVVQLAVANTGERQVPVRGDDVRLAANGTRYGHQPLEGARTFPLAALAPGNETDGWVVFSVPAGTSDVVLVPNTDAAGGTMSFTYDPDLRVNGTA